MTTRIQTQVFNRTHSRKPVIMLMLAGLLGCSIAAPAAAASPGNTLHAQVEGGLSKSVVREVVRGHIEEVRDCYNAELVEDGTIEGRSVVTFAIEPDGSVHDARVPESTMPERFDACLSKAVQTWAFPTSDAQTLVTYPFEFTAE
jgi:TonB family protein